MTDKIKIAIIGYGNVGKGVHDTIINNPDMELEAILTRNVERTKKDFLGGHYAEDLRVECIYDINDEKSWRLPKIIDADVAVLCGGSKNDLPRQGPYFAQFFNTVDSFDTHAHIGPYVEKDTNEQKKGYFAEMDDMAKAYGKTSIISTGWDPGIFSLERVLSTAFLPGTKAYAFYGLTPKGGLSMGHSDAARQIDGVKDARQYTHAIPEAIERVRKGENPEFAPGDMHWRECLVIPEKDADQEKIIYEIKNMEDYFKPYRTKVEFISQKELDKNHSAMPHDGLVIAVGKTGSKNKAIIEYKCQWDSNPEATANILVAHARSAYRMHKEGKSGAFTILDIPPEYLNPKPRIELINTLM